MAEKLLMVFVKKPELGKVKTRLAATIGNSKALAVYKQLLERTHKITEPLPISKTIYYTPEIVENDLWNIGDYRKALQSEGDLGQRMLTAFSNAFADNYEKVCIIGSDCYELNTTHIKEAFHILDRHDVVIGPSVDGGYYLIGMKKLYPSLFHDKAWSTEQVFPSTIQTIKELQLSYSLLPLLNDIDREEDLITLQPNSIKF